MNKKSFRILWRYVFMFIMYEYIEINLKLFLFYLFKILYNVLMNILIILI